jgi:acyl-CoA dehydrogenase
MSLTRSAGEFAALMDNLRDFIESEVIPAEVLAQAHDGEVTQRSAAALRKAAHARGLGAPRLSVSEGGLGLSWEECCQFLEQAGRSFLGPVTLQCADSPTSPRWMCWPVPRSASVTWRPLHVVISARALP